MHVLCTCLILYPCSLVPSRTRSYSVRYVSLVWKVVSCQPDWRKFTMAERGNCDSPTATAIRQLRFTNCDSLTPIRQLRFANCDSPTAINQWEGTIGGLDWTTGPAEIVPRTRSQTKIAIPLVCVNSNNRKACSEDTWLVFRQEAPCSKSLSASRFTTWRRAAAHLRWYLPVVCGPKGYKSSKAW